MGTVMMRLVREIDEAEFSAAELRELADLLAGIAEEARERAGRIDGAGR
ncbi:hypothetical protein [Amycolatopsis magusensis]